MTLALFVVAQVAGPHRLARWRRRTAQPWTAAVAEFRLATEQARHAPPADYRLALARHLRPGDVMDCGPVLPPRRVVAVNPPEADRPDVVTVRFHDGPRWYVRLTANLLVYRHRAGEVQKRTA